MDVAQIPINTPGLDIFESRSLLRAGLKQIVHHNSLTPQEGEFHFDGPGEIGKDRADFVRVSPEP